MRIILVQMPWAPLEVPSLALGILRTSADRAGHEALVRHANVDFTDWVVKNLDFGLDDYLFYSESSYFQGVGDWVFSSGLHGYDAQRVDSFVTLLSRNGADAAQIAMTTQLHELVPGFVEELADEIAALDPDLVGFTTTFQQNTASLGVAKLLKERNPRLRIVFGGANCDGPQGSALHRNFQFVDFVVRGEGEAAFPALLDQLIGSSADFAKIPGLCWHDASGTSVANPMASRPLPPGAIVAPTYDGFFERHNSSVAGEWIEPRLIIEGSRGCWWGEKHHCTFCGLNGSFMEFRSKSPARFLEELLSLAERHQVLDFVVVDNILDMNYFDSVLVPLAETGYDFRLQIEVKSNLRRHHFQVLRDAGAVYVQPGIESLSSRVLRLMDKGVTGCQNVRALRDAESAGVTATWNYLCGFPGETREDYTIIIDQLSRLHHLVAPTGSGRIAIERFSPYFDNPDLGFTDLRPAPQYAQTYRLPESELADLAYVFSAPERGIGEDLAAVLAEAVEAWRAEYPVSRFSWQDLGDRIVLVSRRPAFDWGVLELCSKFERLLFRLLEQPRSVATLAAKTGQAGGSPERVIEVLERWTRQGIVFTDDDTYIHVATENDNQALMRVGHRLSAAGTDGGRLPDVIASD
jgi:ribosomal peptide maturation radical SAM protein 1